MELFAAYPLTPERWDDFVALFGPSGACYGCWCTYFRMPAAERKLLDGAAKKEFSRRRIETGPPPGMLGYVGGQPAAWVQVGPRADVPQWNSPRTVSRPLEAAEAQDLSVWAVSCFFIGNRHRGKGNSHRMVDVAIRFARESGARILEACPMEQAKTSKSPGLYVGSMTVFAAAGFSEVARRKDGRPLMRLEL
ncbi:GNAT family N-acetyltransferase [Neorhizobium alkalisoli]|uniref:GNAT family N-acetyltransferase n=1 Tax=Neorhizobium alkalisoli TaxID=528178 RepID=UPI001472D130|nr:GNAT family N-acetyltransferase [Neorhizobium alkalisoli]